ncbi:uncharacterized protein LOC143579579 [Bidens hawaiensis]|uniref:uncharacterized protein LOC143579579 n=1 Tax=Bidens hawaiensis TaxID=980011 RepID=UPI004048FBF6
MKKQETIYSFFKKSGDEQTSKRQRSSTSEPVNYEAPQQPQSNTNEVDINQVNQQENRGDSEAPQPQSNANEVDPNHLKRDPAKRKPMWEHPVNLRAQVRRAYLSLGPYQIQLKEYKNNDPKGHTRRFQYAWFKMFPNWLEYSPTTHRAYCFLCYLFNDKPSVSHGYISFTLKGFDTWNKVNGKKCALFSHLKTSQHRNCLVFAENLLNQEAHIDTRLVRQTKEEIVKNSLRLTATVDLVCWLTFQAFALRGHDESSISKNRGNLIELLKLLASYNDKVSKVILENAPYHSKYTSSDIQKEILSIIANKVRKHICSEVGDSFFCVMVDESRDESKKEQMAIVLRFVDAKGMIQERFLDLVHVTNTLSATLKTSLWKQLSHYQLDVKKIRGQGYDGASNMRGE